MTPEQRQAVMGRASTIIAAIESARDEDSTAERSKPVHVEGAGTHWLTAAEYRRFIAEMRRTSPVRAPNRHERRKAAAQRR